MLSYMKERIYEASRAMNVFDLDVHKEEIHHGDELGPSIGIKEKILILIQGRDFENVQLDDNLTRLVRIEVRLVAKVKKGLVGCLRANTDSFTISPYKMSRIDPSVGCH